MRAQFTFSEAGRVWKQAQAFWDQFTKFYSECEHSNEVTLNVIGGDEDITYKPEVTIQLNTLVGILESTKVYDVQKMLKCMPGWFDPDEMGGAYYELMDLLEAHIAFRAGLKENDLEMVEQYIFQINELIDYHDDVDLLLKALVHLRMCVLNRPSSRVQALLEAESGLPIHWFRI